MTTGLFDCKFEHPDSGEQKVIRVELAADEIRWAAGDHLYLSICAVRHAYRRADGFVHVAYGVNPVRLN
jgi:hypothetical protein